MLPVVIQASCPLINTDKPFCSTGSLHCPVSALVSKQVALLETTCSQLPRLHLVPMACLPIYSLSVGLVIFIQLCQGLLSNCNGIWSDRITEGKTDLCTFWFLKTDEQRLMGLLNTTCVLGLKSCQRPSGLLDDLKTSVFICCQRK